MCERAGACERMKFKSFRSSLPAPCENSVGEVCEIERESVYSLSSDSIYLSFLSLHSLLLSFSLSDYLTLSLSLSLSLSSAFSPPSLLQHLSISIKDLTTRILRSPA